jgi:hypothetical protein
MVVFALGAELQLVLEGNSGSSVRVVERSAFPLVLAV